MFFSREGYTFAGWNTKADGTGTTYAADATFTITADTTLYAQWTVNQYTITFDTDGGSPITAITQDYDTAITKPADPTKEGYKFTAWSPEIPSKMPAENITVKAGWSVNSYTITFVTDGGTAIDAITQDYGTPVTAPANPTKTGYTFDGWAKATATPDTGDITNVTCDFEVMGTFTKNGSSGTSGDTSSGDTSGGDSQGGGTKKPGGGSNDTVEINGFKIPAYDTAIFAVALYYDKNGDPYSYRLVNIGEKADRKSVV